MERRGGGFKSSYRSQRFHSHQDLLGIPSGSSESNWIEQMDLSKRRRFVRIRPPFCRTEISHRFQNGFKILKKKLNPSGNLQGFDTDLIRIGLGFPSRFIRLRFLSCWDLITRISLPPPRPSFVYFGGGAGEGRRSFGILNHPRSFQQVPWDEQGSGPTILHTWTFKPGSNSEAGS